MPENSTKKKSRKLQKEVIDIFNEMLENCMLGKKKKSVLKLVKNYANEICII